MTSNQRKQYEEAHIRLETWFERDRSYVGLHDARTHETVIEWWDDAVIEAVEDGCLNPDNFRQSAIDYARHLGIAIE